MEALAGDQTETGDIHLWLPPCQDPGSQGLYFPTQGHGKTSPLYLLPSLALWVAMVSCGCSHKVAQHSGLKPQKFIPQQFCGKSEIQASTRLVPPREGWARECCMPFSRLLVSPVVLGVPWPCLQFLHLPSHGAQPVRLCLCVASLLLVRTRVKSD